MHASNLQTSTWDSSGAARLRSKQSGECSRRSARTIRDFGASSRSERSRLSVGWPLRNGAVRQSIEVGAMPPSYKHTPVGAVTVNRFQEERTSQQAARDFPRD